MYQLGVGFKMKGKAGIYLTFFLLIALFLYFGEVWAVQPSGANYTGEVTTTAPTSDPESHAAQAGNVTRLDIYGTTVTQSWQGYYGNVTGTIQLADSNDKILYNWSLTSPEGEVYASTNGSGEINWGNIACFDLATNHESLETFFNISTDDVDGINETFSDANTHAAFYTANHLFAAGDCPATYMFTETGEGSAGEFEEVLLTDQSDTVQVIFASLLEEQDVQGFDGEYYDFEMIVLENGHGTDTSPTNYYFYVELQ